MKAQFVTFDIALKLKELGFNEPCFTVYSRDGLIISAVDTIDIENLTGCTNKETSYHYPITAPLWQQAIDFFKEKYNITIDTSAEECEDGDSGDGPMFEYYVKDWSALYRCYSDVQYLTRESAREAAILKAIKLKLN